MLIVKSSEGIGTVDAKEMSGAKRNSSPPISARSWAEVARAGSRLVVSSVESLGLVQAVWDYFSSLRQGLLKVVSAPPVRFYR